MNKFLKHMALSFGLSAIALSAYGQVDTTAIEEYGVAAIALGTKNSIRLRWAPTHPTVWQLANDYGYLIERNTIMRDGRLLDQPVKVVLNQEPVRPRPPEEWEMLTEDNDYASIAAQALFGETFDLSYAGGADDILQVINKVRETEQRFSMALYCADLSPETAVLSGLAYEDTVVNENEKYFYRIYAAVPPSIMKVDTGSVFIAQGDSLLFPAPQRLRVEFGDHAAYLDWSIMNLRQYYVGYYVERANDNWSFSSVNQTPIIVPSDPSLNLQGWSDSLQQNGVQYHYRVRGVTPFGTLGPPSDTVSGQGFVRLRFAPRITLAEPRGKSVWLEWAITDSTEIERFDIYRSDEVNGQVTKIGGPLPKNQFFFEDISPHYSNYYTVRAYGEYDQFVTSFPVAVILEDSIPPPVPHGLVGSIDTTGIVNIRWDVPESDDLIGYRIFRANKRSEEFIQVNSSTVTSPFYADTITMKTIDKSVYYKVQSVDSRFNNSTLSEVLTVNRPDIKPPAPPEIVSATKDSIGVKLNWIPSSSSDVTEYLLYRRVGQESQWNLVKVISNKDSSFQIYDESLEFNSLQYTLLAVDESGLESLPARPVSVDLRGLRSIPGPEYLNVSPAEENNVIDLSWAYSDENVDKFLVFRSTDDTPLSLLSTASGESRSYRDNDVRIGKTYSYRVKATYPDGQESNFSEPITITY